MSEYEEPMDNALTHSLDSQFKGLDIPIIQTDGEKKALDSKNEKLRCSTREKNPVSCFRYNDYMAYHYAFMMKVTSVREPETLSKAVKDPRWVAAMNEEMEALCKNEIWDLIPHTPHKKVIGC